MALNSYLPRVAPMTPVRSLRLLSLLTLMTVAGCASLPAGKPDPRDRFERFNRSVFSFNQGLDRNIAKPVAKAYVKVTPAPPVCTRCPRCSRRKSRISSRRAMKRLRCTSVRRGSVSARSSCWVASIRSPLERWNSAM